TDDGASSVHKKVVGGWRLAVGGWLLKPIKRNKPITNHQPPATFSIQQIFPPDRQKTIEFRLPHLAHRAGVSALTESVEDFLVDQQAVEPLGREIFGEQLF